MHWAHHGSLADWDGFVKADESGRFRVTASSAVGIVARHAGYRDTELDYQTFSFRPGTNQLPSLPADGAPEELVGHDSEGLVLRSRPLLTLQARFLDPDGKPVANVSYRGSRSDAQGRFPVQVTREEWNERTERNLHLYAHEFQSVTVPLADLAFDEETVIVLDPKARIEGQVLDEHGMPVEDCIIALRPRIAGEFITVPGPYREGRWQQHVGRHHETLTLRVTVAGSVRSLRQYKLTVSLRALCGWFSFPMEKPCSRTSQRGSATTPAP